MLTRAENELLCRVEGDAAMGQLFRRYWLPAVQSKDLAAGGAPRRVRILGDDFVAFRATDGRVGLLDENCPHRGASLVLANNVDCALQCLYHGWRIAPSGEVLETPAETGDSSLRTKVRAHAYPLYEAGGVVWAYLGPPGNEPPRMDFSMTTVPDDHLVLHQVLLACNWAQVLEGAIDSAHSNYLHANGIRPAAAGAGSKLRADEMFIDRPSNDGQPRVECENTAYGFRYAALRKPIVDPDRSQYVRATLFVAPCYAMFPPPQGMETMQAFVPVDDEHTMLYFFQAGREPVSAESRAKRQTRSGFRPGIDLDDEYRNVRNRANNWMQDREAMRRGESHTGIMGVNNEDIAVQEAMGPIFDRTKEHLGTSDIAVIRMRRIMLDAARALVEEGTTPIGLTEPVPYNALHAIERMLPLDASWRALFREQPA
jgi:phthalate 4,5-dioxygenase